MLSFGFPILVSLATFPAILLVVPLSLLSLATFLFLQPLPLVRLSLLVLTLGLVLLLCLVLSLGLVLPLCLVFPFSLVLPIGLVLSFGLVLPRSLVFPLSPGWICLSCLPV